MHAEITFTKSSSPIQREGKGPAVEYNDTYLFLQAFKEIHTFKWIRRWLFKKRLLKILTQQNCEHNAYVAHVDIQQLKKKLARSNKE